MAETPESSEHTSIKERIRPSFELTDAVKEQIELQALLKFQIPLKPLLPFENNVTERQQLGILFSLNDYLELVDYTGRIIRPSKRGSISQRLPPILERLEMEPEQWLEIATEFESRYRKEFSRQKA